MKYIRLLIENTEPLCISNAASSQSGQTDCIRYIPGTTLRGYVISSIAKDGEFFEKYKKELFSGKVSFLNGYPCSYENGKAHELIPSLKGFYETKKAEA